MRNVIVGAGAFAEVARCYFEEYSSIRIDNFAVNKEKMESNTKSSLDLVTVEDLICEDPRSVRIFVAIGYSKMNKYRSDLFNQFSNLKFEFLSFVHPEVKIWENSTVGQNCFIFEDNTIQPFTKIGDNTILWSGNHIGHHTTIGKNCFISSQVVISGSCIVGNNCFIGVNATVHDGVKIGDRTLIGAGAIISRDTNPDSVYAPKATVQFPKSSSEVGF
jgi:sugar O-acyltransferase (sialic acid O-acetyltransferase NeuD family)